MFILPLKHVIARVLGKVPLRTVLIVPFVLQIFGTVGLVGYLSFKNGQQAVSNLATQLQNEVSARIRQKLDTYLATPHLINQLNADAGSVGLLNPQDLRSFQIYFWKQMQQFPSVSYIYFGTEQGEFIGIERFDDDSLWIQLTDRSTKSAGHRYRIDQKGDRASRVKITALHYDPRQRPWYKTTLQTGKPTWSKIYPFFAAPKLTISATQPFYDRQGKLRGVLGADLVLSQIGQFLRTIKVGESGQTFIIERNGLLVASSTISQPFLITADGKTQRIEAKDSSDPLTQKTAQYLSQHFSSLDRIETPQQLKFWLDGEQQFLQVVPFRDGRGIDWLIVVVVPSADFMAQINANTHTTILLCVAALIVATGVGILTARWVVKPILYLNLSAQALSQSKWEQTVELERCDELGELAKSFNIMAHQLQESFATLEAKNAQMKALNQALSESESRLAQFLEAMPVAVFVTDRHGKPYYTNQISKQILGQGIVESAKSGQLQKIYQVYLAGSDQLYPSDRDPIMNALKGKSIKVDDMEIRRHDKTIPIETLGMPIYDESGNIAYAIVVFQDITNRKEAEYERLKFTNELFRLNQAFSRFVPRQFLQLLDKKSIVDVQLGDQVQQEMSVLFSDIRDFTTLSERITPEENFKFINSYLSYMEPAISENHGFIDKYIGDGIMALFSGSADDAVQAGIIMLQRLAEYNQYRAKSGYVPIKIGIGINTGSLMLGTVGGQNRMDTTVISDAVNLASRMESLTKNYGVSMLITHHTLARLHNPIEYCIRFIEQVKVKGKSKSVAVFEVFDGDEPQIKESKLATKAVFEEGLFLYYQHDFRKAAQRFKECLRINPRDTVAQIYLKALGEADLSDGSPLKASGRGTVSVS